MNYYGYEWDISSTRLLLDADLNTDNLGWKFGDYFKLIEKNGRAVIEQGITPFTKFHKNKFNNQN